MAERAAAADTVDETIRRLEGLDAAAGMLRATAPGLAAALGTAARLKWTPIGYLPDLTRDAWEAAADENQARHRPPERLKRKM